MEINASEVFSIIQSLEARREWIQDIDPGSGADSELPFIQSAIKKFTELKCVLGEENE